MYEKYTRQSLPSKQYRELLGAAICVFNSNASFVIETILKMDSTSYNWFDLIDITSGRLLSAARETISQQSDSSILEHFSSLVEKRNRIIHSFQVTENERQIFRTKTKDHIQFSITEEYLLEFIKENESLSLALHKLRGY